MWAQARGAADGCVAPPSSLGEAPLEDVVAVVSDGEVAIRHSHHGKIGPLLADLHRNAQSLGRCTDRSAARRLGHLPATADLVIGSEKIPKCRSTSRELAVLIHNHGHSHVDIRISCDGPFSCHVLLSVNNHPFVSFCLFAFTPTSIPRPRAIAYQVPLATHQFYQ